MNFMHVGEMSLRLFSYLTRYHKYFNVNVMITFNITLHSKLYALCAFIYLHST